MTKEQTSSSSPPYPIFYIPAPFFTVRDESSNSFPLQPWFDIQSLPAISANIVDPYETRATPIHLLPPNRLHRAAS
jgi:hypothetical protein